MKEIFQGITSLLEVSPQLALARLGLIILGFLHNTSTYSNGLTACFVFMSIGSMLDIGFILPASGEGIPVSGTRRTGFPGST